MGLDGVGVEAVIDLRQGAIEVPCEGEAAVFVLLDALEFLDEVDFELGTDPHPELEGDVVVGVGSAVPPGSRPQTDGVGLFDPFLDAELVAVQAGLTFNYGEFAGIKIGVVDGLPDAEELDGVPVPQPIGDEELSVLGPEHVSQRDVVLVIAPDDGNLGALDVDRGAGRFLFQASPPFALRGQRAVVRKFRTTGRWSRWGSC